MYICTYIYFRIFIYILIYIFMYIYNGILPPQDDGGTVLTGLRFFCLFQIKFNFSIENIFAE